MKFKMLLLSSLASICLRGCSENFQVKSDFDYKDDSFEIADTLENVTGKKAHIVLLYGQSNADGVSLNEYLQYNDVAKYSEYVAGYDNVFINYCNDGWNASSNKMFQKCTLGCGCSSQTFGPEMGIAEKIKQLYPDETTFIIKWTWGGTALRHEWLDGSRLRGKLYNSAMDFSLKCLNYLASKGYSLSIEGICWMQGESDAWESDWNLYYKDTNAFVSYLRHDLKAYSESIKFLDAAINEEDGVWPHPEVINKAKREFSNKSSLNIYIDTNALGLTTQREPAENPELGRAFGDALRG